MRLRNLSLGTKLNLALLAFLLVLVAAMSALILYGFRRSQDNATKRSSEALEEQGKLALLALVGGATESGGLQFEAAAEIGKRAADYLASNAGVAAPIDASNFDRSAAGVYYDPDPARQSDVVVINGASPADPAVRDDIAFSSRLNEIFPILLKGFAGEVGGENFNPIAMVFVGASGAARYYPPVGIHQSLPGFVELAPRMDLLGPVKNPDRKTLWTTPYEDTAGQGQIVTARSPVYDGDTFRGTMEVDLSLSKLIDQLNNIHPTQGSFAFYVGTDGKLVQSNAYQLLTSEAATNQDLKAVLEAMRNEPVQGNVSVGKVQIADRDYYISHAHMLGLGGSFAVASPVSDITAQAAQITNGIDDEGNRTLIIMLVAMGALFVAGLVGATWFNRRLLVSPLQRLVVATRNVAAGDLDTRVDLQRGDELGELAQSFNTMTAELRQRRDSLEQEIREREATQEELRALLAAMTDVVMVFDRDGRCLRIAPTNPDLLYVPAEDAVGRTLHEIMPAEEADVFVSTIRAALTDQQAKTIEYPLEIGQRQLWFSATISPMSTDAVVYVARDITERVNASQNLERQVEERTRELDALLRADHELFRSLDLAEVLQALVDVAVDVIGAEKSVVTIWDRARSSVSIGASRNVSPAGLKEFAASLPAGVDLPDEVGINIFQDPNELAARPEFGRLVAAEGIQASMDLPIRSPAGLVVGGYGVGYTRPHVFDEAERQLLAALAERAAVAIQNAELYARAQQAASLEERQRLARELHDSVSQALYGIALGARTARALLDSDPAKVAEPIDYVLSLAEAGLTEMRALIFELRPESLAMEGVVAALDKQIASARARHGLDISFEACPEPDTPIEAKEAVYRIGQEALHNIIKHAKAHHADVTLSNSDGHLFLRISDDGQGFDPSGDYAGHLGLRSMRERAARVGASLDLTSVRGKGTTVLLRMPLTGPNPHI